MSSYCTTAFCSCCLFLRCAKILLKFDVIWKTFHSMPVFFFLLLLSLFFFLSLFTISILQIYKMTAYDKKHPKTYYSLPTPTQPFFLEVRWGERGHEYPQYVESKETTTQRTGWWYNTSVVRALSPAMPALLAQARPGKLPAREKNTIPTNGPSIFCNVHTSQCLTRPWDVLAQFKHLMG